MTQLSPLPVRSRSARSLKTITTAAALCLLAACASVPEDETATWSVQQIYEEANASREANNYDRASKLLEKLEARAAGTLLAQQAQLDRAFTHYKANEPVLAMAVLERFMRLHPASPAMDYALYLRGLINFNNNLGLFGFLSDQDLSERDQKSAKVSFEAFKELSERFPNSVYTADAKQRMTYIVNALAMSEVHVANHYLKRGAHLAAVNRAQQAIKDYPQAPAVKPALQIMITGYEALKLKDLAEDARRVLATNFPDATSKPDIGTAEKPWWRPW